MTAFRLTSITTKWDQTVRLSSLNVLVGPNNAGKTRILKDIVELAAASKRANPVVIKDIDFDVDTLTSRLGEFFQTKDDENNPGHVIVFGLAANARSPWQISIDRRQFERLTNSPGASNVTAEEKKRSLSQNLGRFFVLFLDAESRLTVSNTSPSRDQYLEPPSTLVQAFYNPEEYKSNIRKLGDAFKDTFDQNIAFDYGGMKTLRFRIAHSFPALPEAPHELALVMKLHSQLEEEGDGYRSFVGALIAILASGPRLILLDEPEAFLHPPQAKALGRTIGKLIDEMKRQIVLSTHNSNFLRGLLETNNDVTVLRLNRVENNTSISVLPTDKLRNVINSPTLSSHRILDALFHRGVVVCEGDNDRAVYDFVATREFGNQEIFVTHAHNKQTAAAIAPFLRDCGVLARYIVDLDIIDDKDEFARFFQAVTGSPVQAEMERKRAELAAAIEGKLSDDWRNEVTTTLEQLSERLKANQISSDELRRTFNGLRRQSGRWAEVRRKGIDAWEEPLRRAARELLAELRAFGIFVVPKGVLESWIAFKDLGRRNWTVRALEWLTANSTPADLKAFVGEALGRHTD